jgi:hypothetical protein
VGRRSLLALIRPARLRAAVGLGLALAGPAGASADALLVRLAEESGCAGPPQGYVAGYFSARDAASGVFWCRRDERHAAEGRVVIVVVDRHSTRRLACPSAIVAINEPAELRVLREPALPLSAFVVRHEPWRTGPAGQRTAGPVVEAVDGAVGEQWVCHRGTWLVRVYH